MISLKFKCDTTTFFQQFFWILWGNMSATYNGEGLKWISFFNKLEDETRSEIPSEAFFFLVTEL